MVEPQLPIAVAGSFLFFDMIVNKDAHTAELTAADGTVISADGLIEILSLDEKGKAVLKSDVPFGS